MADKEQPLVSIVVPVYNSKLFIADTIATVQAQSYSNWELLLIDDCSTDNSVELIKQLKKDDKRIKLISMERNSGAALARNMGIDTAKGQYLAFLDADDIWASTKLEKQVIFMQKAKSVFSFTSYEFAEENGSPTGKKVYVPTALSYGEALKRSAIFTSTVLINLSIISKSDLMMPNYKIGEETATWWHLLKQYGDAQGVNEILSFYRRGSGGTLSSNKVTAAKWRWYLYRKHEQLSLLSSLFNFFHYAKYALERRV